MTTTSRNIGAQLQHCVPILPGEPGAYGNVILHPNYPQLPGLSIYRLDSPLYSFNTNTTFDQIIGALAAADLPPKAVLFDIGATNDLDVATMDALEELIWPF